MRSVALILILCSSTAYAQEQRQYAPFTMDQKTYTAIIQYLNEVPFKYANPVISALAQKEQEAFKKQQEQSKDTVK